MISDETKENIIWFSECAALSSEIEKLRAENTQLRLELEALRHPTTPEERYSDFSYTEWLNP